MREAFLSEKNHAHHTVDDTWRRSGTGPLGVYNPKARDIYFFRREEAYRLERRSMATVIKADSFPSIRSTETAL